MLSSISQINWINWYTIGGFIATILAIIHLLLYCRDNLNFVEFFVRVVCSFLMSWLTVIVWIFMFILEWIHIPEYPEDYDR